MKKIILILVVFMFCTGCSIEYNIFIDQDKIIENINIEDLETENRTKENILNEYNKWIPTYINFTDYLMEYYDNNKMEGVEYHNKTIQEYSNGYRYNYNYTYPLEKYYDASVLREAYENRVLFQGDNYIVLNTSRKNILCDYSYFDNLTINIEYNENIYKLNNSNAENVNNNKLTWILDKNNCNDSEINLVLDIVKPNNDSNNPIDSENKETNKALVYIVIGSFIIIMGIVLFIKKRVL